MKPSEKQHDDFETIATDDLRATIGGAGADGMAIFQQVMQMAGPMIQQFAGGAAGGGGAAPAQ
ncbi:MAG TPA: hypothetical protein VGM88_04650 [Kofleriaceae bacterium]|jgi:hypothetical protein